MSENTSMEIGPTKYSSGGRVRFAKYDSGETAILIIDKHNQQDVIATVSVVPYGAPDPGEDGVWIKDWPGNEGVAEALVKAGVIEMTGRKFETGFVIAQHAKLTPEALKQLERAKATA